MAHTKQQKLDLSGRNALIVGASRGLGLQLAQVLGLAGARVMLCARQPAALEQAVAQLQDRGIDARWCAADCTQSDQVAYLVSETLQRMGDIDILVSNAGLVCSQGTPPAVLPLSLAPHLRSYVWQAQTVVERSMQLRQRGHIIQMAPLSRHPLAADVIGLTRELAAAWRGLGISVNALCSASVCPSDTATLVQQGGADFSDDDLQGIAGLLASTADGLITGQCLHWDSLTAPATSLDHRN